MTVPAPLPQPPLLALRASRSDFVRGLLARLPAFAHVTPARTQVTGDRGVSCYRLSLESFFVQVRWRWLGDAWDEREIDVVPGSVVALRLVLDDVAPSTVTRRLDLAPTRAFAKGEAGPLLRARRDEGLWIHEVLPGACCFPEEKLAELLAQLRARPGWREVLGLRGVTWAGITVKLRAPLERLGGFALEPRVLEDLVGLSLAFDLQFAGD